MRLYAIIDHKGEEATKGVVNESFERIKTITACIFFYCCRDWTNIYLWWFSGESIIQYQCLGWIIIIDHSWICFVKKKLVSGDDGNLYFILYVYVMCMFLGQQHLSILILHKMWEEWAFNMTFTIKDVSYYNSLIAFNLNMHGIMKSVFTSSKFRIGWVDYASTQQPQRFVWIVPSLFIRSVYSWVIVLFLFHRGEFLLSI